MLGTSQTVVMLRYFKTPGAVYHSRLFTAEIHGLPGCGACKVRMSRAGIYNDGNPRRVFALALVLSNKPELGWKCIDI